MTEHQRPLTEPDAALTAALTSVNDAALTEPVAALGPNLAALTEPQRPLLVAGESVAKRLKNVACVGPRADFSVVFCTNK
jgi:hypothetical protein